MCTDAPPDDVDDGAFTAARQLRAAGQRLQRAGDPRGAVAALQKAVQMAPGFAAGWLSLGTALQAVGFAAEAWVAFSVARGGALEQNLWKVAAVSGTNADTVATQYRFWHGGALQEQEWAVEYGRWLVAHIDLAAAVCLVSPIGAEAAALEAAGRDVCALHLNAATEHIEQSLSPRPIVPYDPEDSAQGRAVFALGALCYPVLAARRPAWVAAAEAAACVAPAEVRVGAKLVRSKQLDYTYSVQRALLREAFGVDWVPDAMADGAACAPLYDVDLASLRCDGFGAEAAVWEGPMAELWEGAALKPLDLPPALLAAARDGAWSGVVITEHLCCRGGEPLAAPAVRYAPLPEGAAGSGVLRASPDGALCIEWQAEDRGCPPPAVGPLQAPIYHTAMVNDVARGEAYRSAIAACEDVPRDAVVLDVGCGMGLLSLFAGQAGFKCVYAVERNPDLAAYATRMLQRNGCEGQVRVLEGHSDALRVPGNTLPAAPSLLLHEVFGSDPLSEHVLPTFHNLRRHGVLTDATRVVPSAFRVRAAFIDCGHLRALAAGPGESAPGLSPRLLAADLHSLEGVRWLSEPAVVWEASLHAASLPALNGTVDAVALRARGADAPAAGLLAYWFDYSCAEGAWAPSVGPQPSEGEQRPPPAHWQHNIEVFPKAVPCVDGVYTVRFEWMADRCMFFPTE